MIQDTDLQATINAANKLGFGRLDDRDQRRRVQFNQIRIRLASPDVIRGWSHGEVTKPETIIPWCRFLYRPVITPRSTRSTTPSLNISVWMPRSR